MVAQMKWSEEAVAAASSGNFLKKVEELYHNRDLDLILPANLLSIAKAFDEISHAHFDSIAVSILCILPCLCGGATVSQEKGMQGRALILYMLLLAPSGVGKTSVAMMARKYFLSWLDADLKEQGKVEKQKSKKYPDVFLDGASAEGLEASFQSGSAPHLVMDEFGKFATASKNDVVKLTFLRMIMQIYDSGTLVTRKLKDSNRSELLMIKGMGLFAASTIGRSNLTPQDMRNMIADGLLNRFLVIFGQYKRIPLRQELTAAQVKEVEIFSREFHDYAREKQFYLGTEALKIYEIFHETVNEKYYQKYKAEDDTAGMDVRSLTVVQRISMLFQVCKNMENSEPERTEIEAISMTRAVQLLEYLDRNHFDQILLYANSKDGRPTLEDRVLREIQKKDRQKVRDIVRNLNGVKTMDVHAAVHMLVRAGLAIQDQQGFISKA